MPYAALHTCSKLGQTSRRAGGTGLGAPTCQSYLSRRLSLDLGAENASAVDMACWLTRAGVAAELMARETRRASWRLLGISVAVKGGVAEAGERRQCTALHVCGWGRTVCILGWLARPSVYQMQMSPTAWRLA